MDKVVITVKGQPVELKLPQYGEVKLTIVKGKVMDTAVTDKTKYY